MRAPKRTVTRARALRRALTLPEIVLWTALRRTRLDGLRFRRQHPIGPYVLDVFCPEARLAIEVDGAAHDHPDQVAHDERRTAWLADQGIRILRLPARDVLRGDGAEHVLPTISAACAAALAPSTACGGPPPPQAGEEPAPAPFGAPPPPAGEGDHAVRRSRRHGGGGAAR